MMDQRANTAETITAQNSGEGLRAVEDQSTQAEATREQLDQIVDLFQANPHLREWFQFVIETRMTIEGKIQHMEALVKNGVEGEKGEESSKFLRAVNQTMSRMTNEEALREHIVSSMANAHHKPKFGEI